MLGLRVGDPNDEVLGAWIAKESVRDVYLTDDPRQPEVLLDKAIAACETDEVPEIRTLARTLWRWHEEILNHHRTGASNGPTEGSNFCAKQVKRAGRGFTNFEHYKLRVLLHTGGVTWPKTIKPPKIGSCLSPLKPGEPDNTFSDVPPRSGSFLVPHEKVIKAQNEVHHQALWSTLPRDNSRGRP